MQIETALKNFKNSRTVCSVTKRRNKNVLSPTLCFKPENTENAVKMKGDLLNETVRLFDQIQNTVKLKGLIKVELNGTLYLFVD